MMRSPRAAMSEVQATGLVAAAPDYGDLAVVVFLNEPPHERFRAGEVVRLTTIREEANGQA
jgi:hypothetical protein